MTAINKRRGAPFGTTYQNSTTHAPEFKKGVTRGKTTGKGYGRAQIVPQANGPTVTCNDPAVDFPSHEPPLKKAGK